MSFEFLAIDDSFTRRRKSDSSEEVRLVVPLSTSVTHFGHVHFEMHAVLLCLVLFKHFCIRGRLVVNSPMRPR